jgi:hypothetical protein
VLTHHPRAPIAMDVDQLHVVVVPILLGRGVRLWDSGVTHLTFTRAA